MRGPQVPSFIDKHMITEQELSGIVADYVKDKSIFPVELSVRSGNRIFVYIDGDQGVTIDECKALNRFIDSKLNRDEEDYELTVSTSGADSPLRFPRQYPKHVGRTLHIRLQDGTEVKGKLAAVAPDQIEIEPAPAGKGKPKTTGNLVIAYDKIREATIELAYK